MTTTGRELGIEKSVLVDAPIAEVFAYYAEPTNLPEVWPSMLEVKDVQRDEDGFATGFRWVYKMAGMRLEGSTAVTECVLNDRTLTRSRGGVESTIDTYYEDHDGRTLVRDRISYRVPVPLVGRIAERFLAKSNEHELETIHKNLKARLESGRER